MREGDLFSKEFVVSEALQNGFVELFKDRNPLHVDKAFAVAKGFQGRVMHGNILNGFLSFFIGECLPIKNVMIYSQEIHFRKPVYAGDVLQYKAMITTVFESTNVAEFKFVFERGEQEKVANGKIQIGILK